MSLHTFENEESKSSPLERKGGDGAISTSAISGDNDQAIYNSIVNGRSSSSESSLPSFKMHSGAIEFGAIESHEDSRQTGSQAELKLASGADGDSGGSDHGSFWGKLKATAEGAYESWKGLDLGKEIREGVYHNTGAFGDSLRRGGTEDSDRNRVINAQIKEATG